MKPIIRELKQLYPKRADAQTRRYRAAQAAFAEHFGTLRAPRFFSAPGSTRICGNQTEYNNGKVFAAAVDADTIAVAQLTDENIIRIKPENAPEFSVNIDETEPREDEANTLTALVRGIVKGFKKNMLNVGGFYAYITSAIPENAELARRESFEVLIGSMLCHLYNEGQVPQAKIARIAWFAETEYFKNMSFITGQIACAAGGFAMIDYRDSGTPIIEPVSCDFEAYDHALCIVNPQNETIALSPAVIEERELIVSEMKAVAGFFDCDTLRSIALPDVILNMNDLRRTFGDRAVLRAIHFFDENERVERMIHALKNENFEGFLHSVRESGNSSFKYLQNVCSASDVCHQSLSIALNVAENSLHSKGACRIHSDGFTGTIQAFVPLEDLQQFRMDMERSFGSGSCSVLTVRPVGGTEVLITPNA